MKVSLAGLSPVRLGVALLNDRLAVAALTGERVETFTIASEDPAATLREELTNRGLAPRVVALALARAAVFVRPMELPAVGGDMREMVRLNLDGHLPVAGDDTAFDFVPLPAEAKGALREEALHRLLVVAAEPRIVEAALRLAEEARLRPVSLTVAAHDLVALVQPRRGQRVVWLHRTGPTTDVLCLLGSALVLSRSVPAADDAGVADEVRRSLAVVRWRECDAIWVSGDLGLDAPALAALGAPVVVPPYTRAAQARLATLPAEDRGAHELALAVAAARRGRALDLLPAGVRPRRLTRAQGLTLTVAAGTALLLVTALLVPGYREQRHLSRINAQIARLDSEVRATERLAREVERKRKLLTTVTGLEAGALRPLPVLRELTDLLPNDTWLTTLSLDPKGVELTGQAAAASALIPLLENSPRLERVEFSSPVTRGRDKEQFRIRAAWEAGVTPTTGPAPASGPAPRPGGAPRS
ncbi:MAG TPA: PilN domain-containing protein [Methylomirabilota bacterium]|nr:PilN domain-containing protein [Methylomirabilota bacterium]